MKPYATRPSSPALPHYPAPESFCGEFLRPAGCNRPRMRWWVPTPYLSEAGLDHDLKAMAKAGFGGAEVVPMPRFDTPGSLTIEWGTPRWKALSRHMLEAAGRHGITVDFSMTPFWPLALPVITDAADPAQGAQMEADGAWVDGITREHPYAGKVPVSAQAVEDASSVGTAPRLVAATVARYADKAAKTLCYDSARALTLGTEVLPDSADPLTWRVDFAPEGEGEYVLFGWWEHPSGERTCQNLQLDHYSRAATEVLTGYWERELIPVYGREFATTVAMFIDSLEYQTHLDWTHGFLDTFREWNGYDFAPYLPALYDEDSSGCFVDFPVPDFRFDRCNDQIVNDYGEFLTRLYIENHLQPLNEFCERNGILLRYQTAYGKTLELAQTAMHVAIPETETLYGADLLDFYRLQSGALHLAGKRIYSIEASAEMNGRGCGGLQSGNYQQTWGNQLWHIQRAMAAGVNQFIFHGYSYEGFYEGEDSENGFLPGCHWPGYTTMGYNEFSNNWSACQPNWLHVNHYTDFIARNQLVLRHGAAKIDLAIYRHAYTETIDFNGAVKVYDDGSLLEQLGYSYDFISPAAMALPNATVTHGRLDMDGPAYGALIVADMEALPASTAQRLLTYALDGLPVVFAGRVPDHPAFHLEEGIDAAMARLLALPNVRRVARVEEVPAALRALGVRPAAAYRERCPILTTRRHSREADYYFFYNYGDAATYPQALEMPAVTTAVTLGGAGIPCLLDAWTGAITPVAGYESTADSVTIPLALGANDSCIVALVRDPGALGLEAPQVHACSAFAPVRYGEDGALAATSADGQAVTVPLSDGREAAATFPPLPQALPLTGWALSLEVWTDSPVPSESVKTVHSFGELTHPVPWRELPGMENASGIGTYRVSFHLDRAWEDGIGYRLELGRVCDSFDVVVNGRGVPANQRNTTLDIGPHLHRGENTLVVTVASTLLNALADYSRRHDLRDSWGKPDGRAPEAYGILGEVRLLPYAWSGI